jgi:hypothetical protein
MTSRWLQRDYFSCGLCGHVQKHIRGYKPIPNPMLFNAEEHCRAYARETKDCVGYIDRQMMKRCDDCGGLHGQWTWMHFQDAIRKKEQRAAGASATASRAAAHAALAAEGKTAKQAQQP